MRSRPSATSSAGARSGQELAGHAWPPERAVRLISAHFEVRGWILGAPNPIAHPGTTAQYPPILAQTRVSA